MIYATAEDWARAPAKRMMLFGMSGLGKTHVSAMLRAAGWFHYSVDYRIGTRYMGEHIADAFKAEAMKVPYLAGLLRSDSIFIGSNITFDNLVPAVDLPGQARRSGEGRPALRRVPPPPGAAPRRPRSRRCWTARISSTARTASTATTTSSATAPARSARSSTRTIRTIR